MSAITKKFDITFDIELDGIYKDLNPENIIIHNIGDILQEIQDRCNGLPLIERHLSDQVFRIHFDNIDLNIE